ncbi:MAG: octaprenyl diphosphate synthase [Methylophilaceae bacterium]|nr:octaprenyl diphosphate synthase [Methylophilaceae bacterium]
MRAVDEVIRSALYSDVVLIKQVAEYIINSGGKRLRPALVLMSAELFGPVQPAHHQLAAVVEFIHTATLLHDDVVDESSLRRGQATANSLFGNAASVLVGDFVYSRAFQMMVRVDNMRVMEILAEATNVIAEGEVLQLLNVHDADISEQDYLQVIHFKTAKLFEAATRLGAVICQANEADEKALSLYGMHLGTAFQLIDDVLDLTGDAQAIGKNLGDDIAEGKPTLPLLYAMRHGTKQQAELIRTAIEHGGEHNIQNVIDAVQQTDALKHVRELAQQEADLACQAIAHLADGPAKQRLIDLAEFSVERDF